MNILVNDQLRRLELIQEKQKIINELKGLGAVSTVSHVISKENHPDSSNFFPVNDDIFGWLSNDDIISGVSESTVPTPLLDSIFDNTSVVLPIKDSDSWIQSFFKDSFNVRAKIKSVEKARFKIFTP